MKKHNTIIDVIEKKKEKRGFDLSIFTMNKKGSVFYFVYVSAFLFAITLLYIIFSQAIQAHLQPIAIDNFMDAGDVAESNKFILYFTWAPYILVSSMLLFLFVRTGQTSTYNR